jgi:hypothetical protein
MRRILLILILAHVSFSLTADGFADWLKRERETFQGFQSREDKAFRDFLSREWEEFEASRSIPSYQEPKLSRQPVVDSGSAPPSSFTNAYPRQQPKGANHFLDFSFRGLPSVVIEIYGISMRFPKADIELPALEEEETRGVADYWDRLSSMDLEKLFLSLETARDRLNLGDWGLAGLVHAYAESQAGGNRGEESALSWFLLIKAGYDVRLVFDPGSGELYLMLPAEEILYGAPYADLDGRRYYFIDFGPSREYPRRFSSYPEGFPAAGKRMSFSLDSVPALPPQTEARLLDFSYQGREISLRLEYDLSLIDYYDNHPQASFGSYLSGGASQSFSAAVRESFDPLLHGRSPEEAAGLLLRFVQTAFAYRTDQDQFSREKWMLPDETLFYPYSDCDDRSVLFAWLVRELLELPVIGIQWPGHMAVAVAFDSPAGGAGFHAAGRRWTLCDPTYMGADVGMVMPVYAGQSFQVVEPRSFSN